MQSTVTEPDVPRYTQQPFPAYRYLPFTSGIPHPIRDPDGHSYGRDEAYLPRFSAADWRGCQPYLYGIDLFNDRYWWEAHEALEAVWLAAGQETLTGNFVQGLIQLAAAQLKRFMGQARGAKVLTESSVAKLSLVEGIFLGIDVPALVSAGERCLLENSVEYPRIKLTF